MSATTLSAAATLLASLSVAVAAGADAGPVVALSFNGATASNALVRDTSGLHNDGVRAGAAYPGMGRYGDAVEFGGNDTDSIVTIGDDGSLDLTTAMTLAAWIYPTDPLVRWPTIIMKEEQTRLAYALYANSATNRPTVHVFIGGAEQDATGTAPIPLRTWTHLAATFDGSTLRLYVNGAQVASRAVSGSIAPTSGPLRVGGNRLWNDEHFAGRIDEVRVYGRALSAAEIVADMNTPIADPPLDPAADGQWSERLDWPFVPIHTILLSNRRVLSWDNYGRTQIFDPASGQVAVADTPNVNTFCAGHAQMPDGKILVAGGHIDAYVGIPDANLFDPRTETWTALPAMTTSRWYPTVTALPDGRLLTVSGTTTCRTCWANDPEVYDPLANTWTPLTAARRFVPFYPHQFVLPDGRVLFTGSQLQPMETLLLDVDSQQWTVVDPVPTDGGSSAMYRLGQVLKSGTAFNPDDPPVAASNATLVLDMNAPAPAWRPTAPMRFPRTQHNLTLLPDGSVLCTGGGRNTDVYDEDAAVHQAEIWSAQTEQWSVAGSMQVPRLYHSNALLLPDGRVLVAGGGGFGPDRPSAELFSPPYLFKGPRPDLAAAPARMVYGTAASVATPDAASIARVTLMRLGSTTHAFNYDQRYLELPFTRAAGGLRLVAPASAKIAPPGYYMLFLVDDAGVPATAQVLRVPRTGETLLGEASDPAGGGEPFRIQRVAGGYRLTWSAPPAGPAPDAYRLYRTPLGAVVNPACEAALGTGTSAVLPSMTGNQGFLVVAQRGGEEGPLGKDSSGAFRPGALGAATCP